MYLWSGEGSVNFLYWLVFFDDRAGRSGQKLVHQRDSIRALFSLLTAILTIRAATTHGEIHVIRAEGVLRRFTHLQSPLIVVLAFLVEFVELKVFAVLSAGRLWAGTQVEEFL